MTIPARYLGDTRSGKRICTYLTDNEAYIKQQIASFDRHDHFDARSLFQWLMMDAFRKHGEFSSEFSIFAFMDTLHSRFLDAAFIDKEKKSLSLVTSIDIAVYGKNLVKSFLVK